MILGVGAGCPEGWVSGGESCYRFYGNAKNCRNTNFYLVTGKESKKNL